MTPDLGWWSALFGRLAVQAAALVTLGAAAALLTRSAQLRRALWQAVFVAIAVGWLAEIAGLPGKFAVSLRRAGTKSRPLTHQLPTVASPALLSEDSASARTRQSPLLETAVAFDEEPPPPPANPPPSRPVAPAVPIKWPGWLWLCGTTVLLLRLAATRAFLALRRRHQTIPDVETEALVSRLRRPLGLRRVSIQIWPALPGPIAFGIWRPTVALPADFGPVSDFAQRRRDAEGGEVALPADFGPDAISPLISCPQAPTRCPRFTPVQREAMLAHELAHLAARDPFWLALADAVVALAWWHPAVWWACRRLRAAGESAADEASALVPSGPSALAESLLVFGRELASPGLTRGLGIAGNGFRSDLSRRVLCLLSHSGAWKKLPAGRRWGLRLTALGIAAAAAVVPVRAGFSGSVLAALASPAPEPQLPGTPIGQDKSSPGNSGRFELAQTAAPTPNASDAADLLTVTNKSARTNLVNTSEGRRRTKAKLDRIRLPEIAFDRLPLVEVLKKLTEESIKCDPDRIGINFMINSQGDAPSASTNSTASPPPSSDLGTVPIKIKPALRDITLATLLDAICQVAEQPITYDIKDFGVLFSSRSQPVLITRMFKIDLDTLLQDMKRLDVTRTPGKIRIYGTTRSDGVTESSTVVTNWGELVREYFSSAKIILDPPKYVFYNDRAGLLMVRATENDIRLIREAIEMLNQPYAKTNSVLKGLPSSKQETGSKDDDAAGSDSAPESSTNLITRTFRVNPNTFSQGVQGFEATRPDRGGYVIPHFAVTNENAVRVDGGMVRHYFSAFGINLAPPRYVFYNDRAGLLIVRANEHDIGAIRTAIEMLQTSTTAPASDATKTNGPAFNQEPSPLKKSASAPPSKARDDALPVSLLVRFTELPEQSPGDLGLDWLFGQSPTNDPLPRSGTAAELLHAKNLTHTENFRVDASRTEGQWAILNESQYAGLIHTVEQREGLDVLTGPSLFTVSGQQSHIGIQDMLAVVSAVEAKNGSPTNKNQPSIEYSTEKIGVGPTLDVTPRAEGGSWRLNALAAYTEFLGYDQPGKADEVVVYHDSSSKSQPVRGQKPLPHFRAREAVGSALLAPGQTLALRGPSRSETNNVKSGLLGKKKTETIRKRLYIFVTVQTVTDTGYVVRTIAVHKQPPYLSVESKEVTIEELRSVLHDEVARNPDLRVQIRPERGAPVGEVLKVIEATKSSGVKITPSLLVTPDKN